LSAMRDWPFERAREMRGQFHQNAPKAIAAYSVFERKPAPDLIRGGYRFA
jgi:hypothetical protein